MTHPSKAKGTKWETALVDWFRENGFQAERLPTSGRDDEGDLVVIDAGVHLVVEAKNQARLKLPEYLDQLDAERLNYLRARNLDPMLVDGIVVVKRRLAPIEKSYVFTTLESYMGVG